MRSYNSSRAFHDYQEFTLHVDRAKLSDGRLLTQEQLDSIDDADLEFEWVELSIGVLVEESYCPGDYYTPPDYQGAVKITSAPEDFGDLTTHEVEHAFEMAKVNREENDDY